MWPWQWVNPITTAEYPLPAQRPSYSLLDCSSRRRALGLAPNHHWRQALLHRRWSRATGQWP